MMYRSIKGDRTLQSKDAQYFYNHRNKDKSSNAAPRSFYRALDAGRTKEEFHLF